MARLPDFTESGLLPPGDYPLTIEELADSILVTGPCRSPSPSWDEQWRLQLVKNLAELVDELWRVGGVGGVGVSSIFIDGSFTEEKDHPNDIDGYFHCDLQRLASGDLQAELNALNASNVWTWDPASRRPYRGYPKLQLPMWHQYRVELYPHVAGFGCGIRDRRGYELEFPSAFRQSRAGEPRGIIKLVRA